MSTPILGSEKESPARAKMRFNMASGIIGRVCWTIRSRSSGDGYCGSGSSAIVSLCKTERIAVGTSVVAAFFPLVRVGLVGIAVVGGFFTAGAGAGEGVGRAVGGGGTGDGAGGVVVLTGTVEDDGWEWVDVWEGDGEGGRGRGEGVVGGPWIEDTDGGPPWCGTEYWRIRGDPMG